MIQPLLCKCTDISPHDNDNEYRACINLYIFISYLFNLLNIASQKKKKKLSLLVCTFSYHIYSVTQQAQSKENSCQVPTMQRVALWLLTWQINGAIIS